MIDERIVLRNHRIITSCLKWHLKTLLLMFPDHSQLEIYRRISLDKWEQIQVTNQLKTHLDQSTWIHLVLDNYNFFDQLDSDSKLCDNFAQWVLKPSKLSSLMIVSIFFLISDNSLISFTRSEVLFLRKSFVLLFWTV